MPLAARVDHPGEALLPARAALAILRTAPIEELSLEGSAGGLVMRWPGACYRLESPAGSPLPPDEAVPAGPCLLLPAEELYRAIRSTLFAAGPSGRRYRLDAVLFEAEPGRLRVVATDNRRLAVAALSFLHPGQGLIPEAHILPAVAVALLASLAETAEDAVQAAFGREPRLLPGGRGNPILPLRGGALPALAQGRARRPSLSAGGAGGRAAWCGAAGGRARASRKDSRLLLSLEPGRLVLESGRTGAGCSRVTRKVPYQGGPVRLALEPRYLVELLRCLEGEETVELGLTDADTPALFRAGGYLHVLMPLRLE